jgi:hypothetical protein
VNGICSISRLSSMSSTYCSATGCQLDARRKR